MKAIHWKSCVLAACIAAGSACGDEEPNDVRAASEMLALDPTEMWAGKTLEEWAVEYMRWIYSPTDCEGFPTYDIDGSLCGAYQDPDSSVFFLDQSPLAEAAAPLVERTMCRVPVGKAIFVPVALFFQDNAGLEQDQQLSDDESISILNEIKRSIRKLVLNADGAKIDRLKERTLGPVRFSYYVPPAPNRFGCDDSRMVSDVTVDPSFFVGTFALFEPPTVGTHQLEYSSTLTDYDFDYAFRVRSQFEVVR